MGNLSNPPLDLSATDPFVSVLLCFFLAENKETQLNMYIIILFVPQKTGHNKQSI